MKNFYIRDCAQQENQTITSFFVVAVKQVKSKKNGELYLSLTLADRSGQLQANMWENVDDALNAFDQDDFVKVKGLIQNYKGRWQLTIHKIRRLGDSEVDYSDYLPKTTKDIDQLFRTLCDFVEGFQNSWLKTLLKEFLADEPLMKAYQCAPAAKTLHHAFVGGLLDHVVSLFTVCDLATRNYPQVDRDLLMTGAFLHDIGKVHELAYQRSIAYTTEGQLLGHMIIELEMLHEKLARIPGFPAELKILIEHMIISHHGQYEFGSPKLPMFPEALMLHYMDDLDSKMEAMRAQFERDGDCESPWSSYNPSLGRPLLNTKKFLEKGLKAAHEAETQAAAKPPASTIAELEEVSFVSQPDASDNGGPDANSPGASAEQALVEVPQESPLEALQRKFASFKVTPVSK